MRVVYGPLGTAPSLLRRTTALSCPPFGGRRCLAARDVGAGESSPRRFRKIAVAEGVLWVWRIAKRPVGRAAPRGREGQRRAGPDCFFAFIFQKCLLRDLLLCASVCVSVCLSGSLFLFFLSQVLLLS